MHIAKLDNNWTNDLVISSQDFSELTEDDKSFLKKKNIKLVQGKVSEFKHDDGMINEVIYEDGTRISRNGAIISVEWDTKFSFLEELQIERDENGGIKKDDFGETSDRKSTRLNSSHVSISYAVFCL